MREPKLNLESLYLTWAPAGAALAINSRITLSDLQGRVTFWSQSYRRWEQAVLGIYLISCPCFANLARELFSWAWSLSLSVFIKILVGIHFLLFLQGGCGKLISGTVRHVHACVWVSVYQSDLRVSHAGGCNESLLQSFVLQSAVLLMSLSAPFQIQQVLDNLWVSTQSGVDQRGLAALIHVVDLEDVQWDVYWDETNRNYRMYETPKPVVTGMLKGPTKVQVQLQRCQWYCSLLQLSERASSSTKYCYGSLCDVIKGTFFKAESHRYFLIWAKCVEATTPNHFQQDANMFLREAANRGLNLLFWVFKVFHHEFFFFALSKWS